MRFVILLLLGLAGARRLLDDMPPLGILAAILSDPVTTTSNPRCDTLDHDYQQYTSERMTFAMSSDRASSLLDSMNEYRRWYANATAFKDETDKIEAQLECYRSTLDDLGRMLRTRSAICQDM